MTNYWSKFAIFVVFFHFGLIFHGVLNNFPTMDEVAHLPAGISHWKFNRFDLFRVNPPLVRVVAAIPAVSSIDYDWTKYTIDVERRPEFEIGFIRLKDKKLDLQNEFIGPRLFCAVFSFFCALILFYWVKKALGTLCANLTVVFWCFSPNILAYSQTILPDIGSVTFGVVASYAFWVYTHDPTAKSTIVCGVALGLALLTKLTWVTGVISFPATGLLCAYFFRSGLPAFSWGNRARDIFLIILIALTVLNAGYLFEGTFKPLGDYTFCSKVLGGPEAMLSRPDNRWKHSVLGLLPVPVPENYLLGIDHLKHEVEEKKWSFLMGNWKYGSWWYYYIMTFLFKTPVPTLLASLIGFGVLVEGIRRKLVDSKVTTMFMFLGIPSGVAFLSVSLQGGFNHHHRYVLQIYPFFFTLAAFVCSPVAVKLLRFRVPFMGRKKRSVAISLALTFCVLMMASSFSVFPHYASYFNSFCGGPESGWRLLGLSNIDWGQDLIEVDKWVKEHPKCRPLSFDLDYFGMNGELFGQPVSSPPELAKRASIDEVRTNETQWWIISVKKLFNQPGQNGLEYLQQEEPIDTIAFSYHIYRISPRSPVEGDLDP